MGEARLYRALPTAEVSPQYPVVHPHWCFPKCQRQRCARIAEAMLERLGISEQVEDRHAHVRILSREVRCKAQHPVQMPLVMIFILRSQTLSCASASVRATLPIAADSSAVYDFDADTFGVPAPDLVASLANTE